MPFTWTLTLSRWSASIDPSFDPDRELLVAALDTLLRHPAHDNQRSLPTSLPEKGLGEAAALDVLAPIVVGGAQRLGEPLALAHMDPPTPWISWATTMWNAALNQNLLHPAVAPVARDIETRLMAWLAPVFGMAGGHMTPGSTISNLTALWAARELRGIKRVVASREAHVSIAKSAHILGLEYLSVSCDTCGRIDTRRLPDDLADSALVLTAGTTSAGAIDDLRSTANAAWTHVDAAWAGPLRLTATHRSKLDGIASADSVAVSAHKWLFQPKESGIILFRDVTEAHEAVSFGGAYLATPNVGLLGSRGANAIPLFATLLAWGREGIAQRIDRAMAAADQLATWLQSEPGLETYAQHQCGVILWRPVGEQDTGELFRRLPAGMASLTSLDGAAWIRHVAANPNVDIDALVAAIAKAIRQ